MNIPDLDQETSDVVTALAALCPLSYPLSLVPGQVNRNEDTDFLMADVLTNVGNVPFWLPVEYVNDWVLPLHDATAFDVLAPCTVTGVRLFRHDNDQSVDLELGPRRVFPSDVFNINWPGRLL